MPDPSKHDLDAIMDVTRAQEREKQVLSMLLEKQCSLANHHLVTHVRMGDVSSFLTSVSLAWVAEKVGFAADLPVFKEDKEGSKRVPIRQDTVDQIQQRQPDWRRQRQMTAYLAARRHHKFPPLLLVGYQGWIYDDRHDNWAPDQRATQDSLTLRSLEPSGAYWDLDDSETEFYALDGQHRLMAILGLRDLIQTGHLHALDEKRAPKKQGALSRDEIIDYIHSLTAESRANVHERLQHAMDERIGVEIVPAVHDGETYSDALRRLRQMFVDVNENAKILTRSELVQLDEMNGFRVVARSLLVNHDLFRGTASNERDETPKVETTMTTLSESSNSYTTLNTLADIARNYLTENKSLPDSERFLSWGNFVAKGIFIRPDDSILDISTAAMSEYFDHLARLPSHVAFIQGKPASEIRSEEDGDNILFRPIVQTALAEAIGKLATDGVSLKNVVDELMRQESCGQMKLRERTSPWFGVLCDPNGNMRRHKKNERLCSRLFRYLLGGGIEDDIERERLRSDFAEERKTDVESAIDLEGRAVSPDSIRLPHPWR